jgi:hypothetical protein
VPLILIAIGCGGTKNDPAPAQTADTGVDAPITRAPGDPPVCTSDPPASTPPAPRGDHAAAFNADGSKLVIYGGDTDVALCGAIPKRKHTDETFVLDVACGGFRPVTGMTPGARARHVMATDGDRAIMFGGRTRTGDTGPYKLFNDVWSFDFKNEAWSPIVTSGAAPAARHNAAGAIDRKRGRLIVFGGSTSTSGTAFTPLDDTYALDLKTGAWTALSSATKPPPRLFHSVAIDNDGEQLYVFSGGDENAFTGPFLRDTWALDLKTDTWRKLTTTGSTPLGRIQFGMSFDEEKKRVIVFGGHDDGKLGNTNEVHTLNVATLEWSRLPLGDVFKTPARSMCDFPADFTEIDKNAPERRSAFAFAPTSDGKSFILHGGKSDCGLLTDVMWWNDLSETFTPLVKSPVGLSCLRYSETCAGMCG